MKAGNDWVKKQYKLYIQALADYVVVLLSPKGARRRSGGKPSLGAFGVRWLCAQYGDSMALKGSMLTATLEALRQKLPAAAAFATRTAILFKRLQRKLALPARRWIERMYLPGSSSRSTSRKSTALSSCGATMMLSCQYGFPRRMTAESPCSIASSLIAGRKFFYARIASAKLLVRHFRAAVGLGDRYGKPTAHASNLSARLAEQAVQSGSKCAQN